MGIATATEFRTGQTAKDLKKGTSAATPAAIGTANDPQIFGE
jgi:hypothetical protein